MTPYTKNIGRREYGLLCNNRKSLNENGIYQQGGVCQQKHPENMQDFDFVMPHCQREIPGDSQRCANPAQCVHEHIHFGSLQPSAKGSSKLVPRTGLEPAGAYAEDFKSSVATIFTTWANLKLVQ